MTLASYAGVVPAADSRLVWAIGNAADGGRDFGPWQCDAVFEVGVSAIGEFPSTVPTPFASWTGFTPTSTTIRFDGPAEGADGYELVIHAYAVGPCPDVELQIGGERGWFWLRPERDDHRHQRHPGSPVGAWAVLRAFIPGRLVSSGANELVVSLVVDEAPGERRPTPGGHGGFSPELRFGAVELWTVKAAPQPAVELRGLPLYERVESEPGAQSGLDAQLADLVVTVGGTAGESASSDDSVTASVRLGDSEQLVELDWAGRTFGQLHARIRVPALDAPAPAVVEVLRGGQVLASSTSSFRPARRWTLHLLPHVHLDVGFTDLQGKVLELHNRNLERALEAAGDVDGYRFSIDGSLIVEEYLASRTGPAGEAVVDALRDGTLSVNAFSFLFLTGLATLEECYRAVVPATDLRRDRDVPITYANLTDVPSYSWAIPSVLAALGIPAFMGIANHTRASTDDSDFLHLQSPVRWRGPDGGEVVAHFSDGYSQLRWIVGDPATVAGAADALSRYVDRYERDDYAPHDLPIVGIHVDNQDLDADEAKFVTDWNERYSSPTIRYGTIAGYFDEIVALRDRLPVVEGDGGSFWEDGVGSGAALTASYRRAQMALASAEALVALVALTDERLGYDRSTFDRAWQALLIGCEHTWTAHHSLSHPHAHDTVDEMAWKAHQVEVASRIAVDQTLMAMSRLAEAVATTGPCLVVANPTGRARCGEVEIEMDGAVRVAGGAGAVKAVRVGAVDGVPVVRLRVDDIPAFGYRILEGIRGESVSGPEPLDMPAAGESVRSSLWEVVVEGGRITSLRSTGAGGRELVDPASPWGLAEVLHVAGGGTEDGRGRGSEMTSLHSGDFHLPRPELTVTGASMELESVERLPWGVRLLFAGSAPGLNHIGVEVVLDDDRQRVDVVVDLDKEAVLAKESVYVAFPFKATKPTVRYDRQLGWVDPAVDHHRGACNEWFTTQNAVAVSGDEGTVVWSSADAPLFTLGDVVRGAWPAACTPSDGTVLSWVMNNYWWTNYPACQEGRVQFRYAFSAAPEWDPAAAGSFGREVRTPIATSRLTHFDKRHHGQDGLPLAGSALLDMEIPASLNPTVVSRRHGVGAIVRLQDVAGSGGSGRIRHPAGPSGAAWTCRPDEERLNALTVDNDGWVEVAVGANAVVNVCFEGEM